mgnify:CR=1 FL=1
MSEEVKDNIVTCGFKFRAMNDRLTRLIFFLSVLACAQAAALFFHIFHGVKSNYYVTTTQGVVKPIRPTSVVDTKT